MKWLKEQKQGKKEKEDKGDKPKQQKKKTYCLYVCAQLYHGDEVGLLERYY